MEGGYGRVRVSVRNELINTSLHLFRGLVRESQCQDFRGPSSPRADEPGDATSDDLGLAGSGSGDHEQRPIAMRHRPPLIGIQARQERAVRPPLAPWRGSPAKTRQVFARARQAHASWKMPLGRFASSIHDPGPQ